MFKYLPALLSALLLSSLTFAETKTYIIDPSHTYPAFEADHQGGLSLWRGKINSTSGTIVLDREKKSGTVDVTMQIASIDFGHEGMNKSAIDTKILDAKQYPTATYTGAFTDFVDGQPTAIAGKLTLKGATNALTLTINKFLCKPHYRTGNEICGADASATFNRADYGIDYGLSTGFLPEIKLLISVEANLQK
jgi:polyisoprenoid-binding protein YceI